MSFSPPRLCWALPAPGLSTWRGTAGRVCVRTPCQASSADPCAAGVTLKGAAFLWSEAGCSRLLHLLCRAGGRRSRARPMWEPPAVPGACPLPKWCFSSCQSSCAQGMGCKFTVWHGKGITQTRRQPAYWGCFQPSKISKNITVRGSSRADALAPTRLLP